MDLPILVVYLHKYFPPRRLRTKPTAVVHGTAGKKGVLTNTRYAYALFSPLTGQEGRKTQVRQIENANSMATNYLAQGYVFCYQTVRASCLARTYLCTLAYMEQHTTHNCMAYTCTSSLHDTAVSIHRIDNPVQRAKAGVADSYSSSSTYRAQQRPNVSPTACTPALLACSVQLFSSALPANRLAFFRLALWFG
ncbi:hypothetical protein DM02DRAFT_205964 [Periconia macrospinosa]|uniref:Uncharacterized protein n=1 Tax=Periconia macrospinosa TaxID=97972 RepID=A0A2V1D7N2_9PLEO|nr:hypothetical protein DM02DRAFT_205964 [Periconia macrospinosa]